MIRARLECAHWNVNKTIRWAWLLMRPTKFEKKNELKNMMKKMTVLFVSKCLLLIDLSKKRKTERKKRLKQSKQFIQIYLLCIYLRYFIWSWHIIAKNQAAFESGVVSVNKSSHQIHLKSRDCRWCWTTLCCATDDRWYFYFCYFITWIWSKWRRKKISSQNYEICTNSVFNAYTCTAHIWHRIYFILSILLSSR